ncbi:MAG: AIPR family protein [Candidatus Shapirobacteria bacterium]
MNNSSSTLIKFPVKIFRKVYDGKSIFQNTTDNDNILDSGNIYSAILSIIDLPVDIGDWTEINPRDPKTSSLVATKIKDTLIDDPEWFLFKNRGLTLLASSVDFDNKNNIVSLEMSEKAIHGLLDGGHTFKVIQEYLADLSEEEKEGINAFIKVEILEGINDLESAVKIVEARNTSIQVKQQSLDELNKLYEPIKEILAGKFYSDNISYKEYELNDDNSNKTIDIKEILSYFVCFDNTNFDDKKHPTIAYSSKAAVVNHYREHLDELKKYIPLLPEILDLRDSIYMELPEAYNHLKGKFGGLTGVVKIDGKPRYLPEVLKFTGEKSGYRIPAGFIYPILASFRNLVDCSAEKCKWKENPYRFFEELKYELASRIGEQAKQINNPNRMGKDISTWRSCYDLVQLEVLKRHL